jgi:hypothetical protein
MYTDLLKETKGFVYEHSAASLLFYLPEKYVLKHEPAVT